MKDDLLECKEVLFGYNGHTVLNGASLTVSPEDFVGVIGPNGAGKSTLIKIMSGLIRPLQGRVTFGGRDLASLSRRDVAKKMAVVAQEETSEFGFTVREEVMLGRAPHHGGLYFENRSDRTIVEAAMEKTRVAHLSNRRIEALSGGERQRVRIARGIAQQPKVLLLDEPTNHLDLYSQISLMELLREINKEGLSILLVSHDINFVAESCDQLNILHNGNFRFSGTPRQVITPENLAASFRIRALVDTNPVTGAPRMTPVGIL